MTPERKQTWAVILSMFSQVWAFLQPTPEAAEAWDFALQDLTCEQLATGARHVLGNSSKQPTPGDIRDGALGKLTWVDVWKRDAWGSVVLQQGAPISVGREQVRVREGEHAPLLLSWGTSDDGHLGGGEPARLGAMQVAPALKGLVDGVAAKMLPPRKGSRQQ